MRYIIGIDLGTTNSSVSYVDTEQMQKSIQLFKIPQVVSLGNVRALPTLPSFCYIYNKSDFPEGSLRLPWDKLPEKSSEKTRDQTRYFVGAYAKAHKDKVKTRLVHSAKSWLSHPGSNRKDKIIPLDAENETLRISPVDATSRYLKHIKDAWDEVIAKGNSELEFNAQEIILTVPASFDEVARSLTMEAARMAGFLQVTFLEEPQAAFYSWIEKHEKSSEKILKAGDKVLVCDVGGGTTDFSLINVTSIHESIDESIDKPTQEGSILGKLSFTRMAVGDHLLLGGDNMDAAIALFLEKKLFPHDREVTSSQKLQLLHSARNAKEQLLGKIGEEFAHIVIQGSGSKVVEGSLATTLDRKEVEQILSEGFFCFQPWDSALKLTQSSGLRSMGLPYENEPSIIKHLANFLASCGDNKTPVRPDYILFNGGALKPLIFQNAIIEALNAWFPEKNVQILKSYDLDLAVSRGAAYYGKARRGLGIRIGGGLPRSYYMVVETIDKDNNSENKALTLVPRGALETMRFEPELTFMLQPNTTVSFQLCTSHVRLHDKLSDIVNIEKETMHMLAPMQVSLKYGKKVSSGDQSEKIPVHLEAFLTEIGTLEVRLKSLKTDHVWLLEFQVRRASGQDNSLIENNEAVSNGAAQETFDVEFIKNAENILSRAFTLNEKLEPKLVSEILEKELGASKREWPSGVTRRLADCLLKHAEFRRKSSGHHVRWWNLIGFLMRPGFGYPADDFRIKELWKSILAEQNEDLSQEIKIQLWICYRRISGGMTKGQQMQLASNLMGDIFGKRSGKIEVKSKGDLYNYCEKIRALGCMELLELSIKERLGKAIVARIASGEANSADYWALGRIGARHLLYGTILNVIPREICEDWICQILKVSHKDEKSLAFLMEQLARKTVYSELNVSNACRDSILNRFSDSIYKERLSEMLINEIDLTKQELEVVFGDYLPVGLTVYAS